MFNCVKRIPPSILARVTPAPLPSENTTGAWIVFGDAQTGKVEEANDRGDTMLWIIRNCEQEQLAAAKAVDQRPWLVRQIRPLRPG